MKPNDRRPCARFRPGLTQLEDRTTPAGSTLAAGFTAFGAAPGGTPLAEVDRPDGSLLARFEVFERSFRGGVRATAAEFDGNANTVEVVATAGPGGGPRVRVFSVDTTSAAVTLLADFFAYEPTFRDGVRVAAGRVAGDLSRDQIILGTDAGGGPRVRVLNFLGSTAVPVATPLADFFAFEAEFRGGVRVGAGDVDGNPGNGDELIAAAGPGGGPRVRVFRADGSVFQDSFALPPDSNSGVNVTVVNGQVVADGAPDDITQRNLILNATALAQAQVLDAEAVAARTAQGTSGTFAPPVSGFAITPVTFSSGTTANVTFGSTATTPSGLVNSVAPGIGFGSATTAPGVFSSTSSVPVSTGTTAGVTFGTSGTAGVTFGTSNTAGVTFGTSGTAGVTFGSSTTTSVTFGSSATSPVGFSTTGGAGF